MKNFICFLFLFCIYTVYGQSFNDYANAGVAAERAANYRLALDEYLKAYQFQPSNAEINQRVGLMYYYLQKTDSAILFYNAALQLNPKDTISYYQRGSCYLYNNENQKALADYTTCSKLLKKVNPNLIFYIGKCCEGLGNWNEAIDHFNQTLSLRPGDKYAMYEIAYCYTLTFDKVNAMKFYDKALAQDTEYYDAYLNRGLLFESQFNNFSRAHDDFEKSIQLKPKNKLSYLYEGMLYIAQKQFTPAKETFDKVLDMYPDFAEAYCQRALALKGLGNIDAACNDLNQSIKLGYAKAVEYKSTVCK